MCKYLVITIRNKYDLYFMCVETEEGLVDILQSIREHKEYYAVYKRLDAKDIARIKKTYG